MLPRPLQFGPYTQAFTGLVFTEVVDQLSGHSVSAALDGTSDGCSSLVVIHSDIRQLPCLMIRSFAINGQIASVATVHC